MKSRKKDELWCVLLVKVINGGPNTAHRQSRDTPNLSLQAGEVYEINFSFNKPFGS